MRGNRPCWVLIGAEGIASGRAHWVPFAKGEGFSPYWREARIAINWSRDSVDELRRRDALPSGSRGKPRLQNQGFYFRPGITYPDVGSGPLSARLLPPGWIFSHKGSAIFVEADGVSELFLLAYLNSALATYFMRKIINTTATASLGYVEKLPFRAPPPDLESEVVERVERIVKALKQDLAADIEPLRHEIDDLIFDLFEIRSAREQIRSFYETVGKAEASGEEDSDGGAVSGSSELPEGDQAANE